MYLQRSPSAAAIYSVLIVGTPLALGGWIGLDLATHDGASFQTVFAVVALLSVGLSYTMWWRWWADKYKLDGSILKGVGRADGEEVDLSQVTSGVVFQERSGRRNERRELYLSLKDPRDVLTIRIANNIALLNFSARSLRQIADQLDLAPSDSAHETAAWLRQYAEFPSLAYWPKPEYSD